MISLVDLANEIRRRFQTAASDTVVYREAPTVGSDRDVMSFFLEWKLGKRYACVAVHVDFLNNRIVCYPDMGSIDPAMPPSGWLDTLLARVPIVRVDR